MADLNIKRPGDCIYPTVFSEISQNDAARILSEFGYFNAVLIDTDVSTSDISLKESKHEDLSNCLRFRDFPKDSDFSEASKPSGNFSFYSCFEIRSENLHEMHTSIQKHRNAYDLICVRSNQEKIVRASCENPKIDFVIPEQNGNSGQINHIAAKAARDNHVAFGFNMAPLFGMKGYRRVKFIESMQLTVQPLQKYDVAILLMTGASCLHELRDVYSLSSFGFLLGLDAFTSRKSLSVLAKMIDVNQKRKSGLIPGEGVEIILDDCP